MTSREDIRPILKHIIYMQMTEKVSSMSYDPKHSVGSILVRNDFTDIASIGYNGNNPSGTNKRDSLESGKSGFLHAEENMLVDATIPKIDRSNYTVYVTMTPCEMCAKRIDKYGVKRIITLNKYEGESAKKSYEIFNSAGIEHFYLKDIITSIYLNTELFKELSNVISDLILSNYNQSDLISELNILCYKQIDYFFEFDKSYLSKIKIKNIDIEKNMVSDSDYIMKKYMNSFFHTLYNTLK